MVAFPSAEAWEQWLSKNHAASKGGWLRIYKKDSATPSVTYPQALDAALCHGWIDGQLQKYDEHSWLRKFTPRRSKSSWSKINTQHAERLIEAGRMKVAGSNEIDAAKQDGRWTAAYDSPSAATLPEDLLHALKKNAKARRFLETLNKANRYAITYRLQTAKKPETRKKRLQDMLAMLTDGKKFH